MTNQSAIDQKNYWLKHFLKAIIFFIFSLVVLSLFRVFFFFYFSTGLNLSAPNFLPAVGIGIRVDAKWLSLALLPAFLFFLCSYWKPFLFKYSTLLAGIGLFSMVLLDAVNFGFFSFYKTPISPLVFGFFQDDTKAILQTLWQDWPILSYLLVLFAGLVVPFIAASFFFNRVKNNLKGYQFILLSIVCILLFAFFIRGSIGKFPLRQEDFAVSKVQLINASVPNGAAALYEATKAWRNFQIKGEPSQALAKFGYASIEEAKKDLAVRENTSTQLSFRPNVVFAVMESMSGDIFNSHDSLVNNTLGALETALEDAIVFRKAVSIENGTFPSLEGLLFDTPISPISQSIYGRKELSFSQVRAFKEAGYRTIFLTGCPEPWRQINDTFKFYGFEEIYGQAAIGEKFPNAEKSAWGIGDKWMFKFAEDLLKEAEGTGRPVFIMMLSTTNHPPFKVPDGEQLSKVDISKLPKTINLEGSYDGNMEMLLKTYQYAANSLGNFILDLKSKGWLKNTIVAATGDHNARMRYQSEGNWHHVFGVPVLFWLPDQQLKSSADTDRWVSHRDIIPTLLAMSTGKVLGNEKGRNLFAKDIQEGAVSFIGWSGSGFVIGKPGMVTLNGKNLECYNWRDDKLVKTESCSKAQEEMGKDARAQRAISEYIVREGLQE